MTQLADTLELVIESKLAERSHAFPAEVRSYSNGFAEVRPLASRILRATDEDADDIVESLPILPKVRVLWPTAGQFRMHGDLQPGDNVLVIVTDTDLSAYLQGNGGGDPGYRRTGDLAGAVAVPGMGTLTDFVAGGGNRIGQDGADIEFLPGEIRAGGAQDLATKADVQAVVDALTNSATLAEDGGATYKANIAAALTAFPVGTSILKGG